MEHPKFGPQVIDGDGAVLGRMASRVAKRLLMGEHIVIVNSEKVVLTGEPAMVKELYAIRRDKGDRMKGPFYPKYPDMILKRAIKGMLPFKKPRGVAALKNLRVYIGTPHDVTGKAEKYSKQSTDLTCKYQTLGDVCAALGAKSERWKGL